MQRTKMAEGVGLEPTSPKAPVFKTGGLPIILTLRGNACSRGQKPTIMPFVLYRPHAPAGKSVRDETGDGETANERELHPRRECVADPTHWPTKQCVHIFKYNPYNYLYLCTILVHLWIQC